MSGAQFPRKRKRAFSNLTNGTTSDHRHEQRNDSSKPGSAKRLHLMKGGAKLKHLSLVMFLSIPEACIARICHHLDPLDLLSLSRSCKPLRSVFMSNASQLLWKQSCAELRLPEWPHISYPRAIAFIFEDVCGEKGCEAEPALRCFFTCRKYCRSCASLNLLDSSEVRDLWPELPENLFGQLTWTSQRPRATSSDAEKGQFYIRSDIIKLHARVQALASEPPWAMNTLRRELTRADTERKKASFDMHVWHNGRLVRRDKHFTERWSIIQAALRSRWGWDPVPYEELPTRLKQIVDHLIDVPHLTKQVWNKFRGDLTWTIKNRPPKQEQSARPFSLKMSYRPGSAFTDGDPVSPDVKLTEIGT